MIKKLLLPVCFLLVCTSFYTPGSGTAHLTCTSASGRTVFRAELQDITGLRNKEIPFTFIHK